MKRQRELLSVFVSLTKPLRLSRGEKKKLKSRQQLSSQLLTKFKLFERVGTTRDAHFLTIPRDQVFGDLFYRKRLRSQQMSSLL